MHNADRSSLPHAADNAVPDPKAGRATFVTAAPDTGCDLVCIGHRL